MLQAAEEAKFTGQLDAKSKAAVDQWRQQTKKVQQARLAKQVRCLLLTHQAVNVTNPARPSCCRADGQDAQGAGEAVR